MCILIPDENNTFRMRNDVIQLDLRLEMSRKLKEFALVYTYHRIPTFAILEIAIFSRIPEKINQVNFYANYNINIKKY